MERVEFSPQLVIQGNLYNSLAALINPFLQIFKSFQVLLLLVFEKKHMEKYFLPHPQKNIILLLHLRKIPVHPGDDRARQLFAVGGVGEAADLMLVGHEAHLDQDGGDVRRL